MAQGETHGHAKIQSDTAGTRVEHWCQVILVLCYQIQGTQGEGRRQAAM